MGKESTLRDVAVGKKRKKQQKPKAAAKTEAPAAEKEVTAKKKGQTLRLDEATWKQLRILAAEEGVTSRSLLIEGLNLVFEKYGKAPIAQ